MVRGHSGGHTMDCTDGSGLLALQEVPQGQILTLQRVSLCKCRQQVCCFYAIKKKPLYSFTRLVFALPARKVLQQRLRCQN